MTEEKDKKDSTKVKEKDSTVGKVLKWVVIAVGIAAGIATIIVLAWNVAEVMDENTELKSEVDTLETENARLQEDLRVVNNKLQNTEKDLANARTENVELKNEKTFLEDEVEEAKENSERTVSTYRGLLIDLIEKGVINSDYLKPFLSEDEIELFEKQEQKEPPLPADVDVYFHPSGWMGDGEYGEEYISYTSSKEYIKITYTPGPKRWAGVYWQHPDGNWGDEAGYGLTGVKKLTFWAKGETGTELVEFKTGGIENSDKAYKDSFEASLGRIELSQNWKKYDIDLTDQDLSSVIGAFAWIASQDYNPNGLTFYLKEIYFE